METKTKFKVGDRVKVVRANMDDKHGYIGDVLTIRSINPNAPYKREEHYGVEEPCRWVFDVDELEYVKFSKADLKPGMVVEYRDGQRRIVLNDCFMNLNRKGYLEFSDYSDDLISRMADYTTIKKVYLSHSKNLSTYCDNDNLTLLWERDEAKEMTITEIEKELGYKVKIVDGE